MRVLKRFGQGVKFGDEKNHNSFQGTQGRLFSSVAERVTIVYFSSRKHVEKITSTGLCV